MEGMDIDVAGIGKLIFTTNQEWNIPHFHFVVVKDSDGEYNSICLELKTESFHKDKTIAVKNMIIRVMDSIDQLSNNKDEMFSVFKEMVKGTSMDLLWETYRVTEVELAKSGRDIGNKTALVIRDQVIREVRESLIKLDSIELDESMGEEAA